jgi:hypothetical protein
METAHVMGGGNGVVDVCVDVGWQNIKFILFPPLADSSWAISSFSVHKD